jgi:YVTN family beta-propeller protein
MKNLKIVVATLLGMTVTVVAGGFDLIESIVPPGVVFEALALNKDLPTPAKPKFRSPAELTPAPDRSRIYICEQTAKRITIFDEASRKMLINQILLPNEVTGCAVSKDGNTLYATCGSESWPTGYVYVVNVISGKVTKRIGVGSCPRSPVLSPDGTKLFVCNQFSNSVSVVDVGSEQQVNVIKVKREPFVLDVTPDGKTLVVGHALPDGLSTDTVSNASSIVIIDIAKQMVDTVRLSVGSKSIFGLTVSPDGKYAFATHLFARFTIPAIQLVQGRVQSNNMAVVDLKTKKLLNDVYLDYTIAGKANPWSVKCSPDSQYLVVAHAGSNNLSIFNYPDFIDTVVSYSSRGINLSYYFNLDQKFYRLVHVATKGPRALAIVRNNVYTAGYFDDAAATMDMFQLSTTAKTTYVIGERQVQNGERLGESNFYDATLCYENWQSCGSCHPQARTDVLNWMLTGEVNRSRNTKSMVHSWWTPPTSWIGKRPHAGGPDGSIRKNMMFNLLMELEEIEAFPMDTFIMALKPMASPFLEKGQLSQSAKRGKILFNDGKKAGCAVCHPAPLFTDNMLHNAGIPDLFDVAQNINTPGLAECWRTGPYGHVGSYTAIDEIVRLQTHAPKASNLSTQELDDLVNYLKSL